MLEQAFDDRGPDSLPRSPVQGCHAVPVLRIGSGAVLEQPRYVVRALVIAQADQRCPAIDADLEIDVMVEQELQHFLVAFEADGEYRIIRIRACLQ